MPKKPTTRPKSKFLAALQEEIRNRLPYDHCTRCFVKMENLKTCEGDPEGIRHDKKCPKCGDIYYTTKGGCSFLRTKYGSSQRNWKPLVQGDPPGFVLDSNWIRSTINLIRNSKDAGPRVLELLISIDNLLDDDAREWREERARQIKDGEIAG